MTKSFSDAVNAVKPKPLIFSFDWQGTLADKVTGAPNLELIDFYCDVVDSKNTALINSSSPSDNIRSLVKLAVVEGQRAGYDFSLFETASVFTKDQIGRLTTADPYTRFAVSFDDEPIASQSVHYANPLLEITVNPDLTTSPFTLDQLRETYHIPRRPQGASPAHPEPTRFPG